MLEERKRIEALGGKIVFDGDGPLSALITKIINKNKNFGSLLGSSRFPGGRTNDLINRTTNICAERWRTGPASFQSL